MCIERYKNRENFLAIFEPGKQYAYTKDLRRVFMGNAPALGTLSRAFGENTSLAWLEMQLIDLSEFSGCKEKLTIFQLHSVAQTILSLWGYYKVTELMYFFMLSKSGEFGHFFGAVDGMVITEAIRKFDRMRCDFIDRYRQEDEERQRRIEDEARSIMISRFNALVRRSMLSHREFVAIAKEHSLTHEELAEIGWLFRLGYERKK